MYSTQPGASAQDSTSSQPVEQLHLNTLEKMGIATQLVGMFTQDGRSVTVSTPVRGLGTVAKGSTVSGTIIDPGNNPKRIVLGKQC